MCPYRSSTQGPSEHAQRQAQQDLQSQPRAALVVVADGSTRVRVERALRADGFDVAAAEEAEAALRALRMGDFDVVVLDSHSGVPGRPELPALASEADVPVIVLLPAESARHASAALERGADDYVVKPLREPELIGRVRALLRRRELGREGAGVDDVHWLHIDAARAEVAVDGRPVHITPSEFRILALLAEEPGRVFSRREIMQHLWESPYGEDPHACEVHISNLRRKIEPEPSRPERIVTVRGVGYKLGQPERS